MRQCPLMELNKVNFKVDLEQFIYRNIVKLSLNSPLVSSRHDTAVFQLLTREVVTTNSDVLLNLVDERNTRSRVLLAFHVRL